MVQYAEMFAHGPRSPWGYLIAHGFMPVGIYVCPAVLFAHNK